MKTKLLLLGSGILILASAVFLLRRTSAPIPAAALTEFAQCLTTKGVTMYGAWWCPHCQNQKELFGDSFSFITYIECASKENLDKKTCERAGIQGFPTWIFADGSRHAGELPLKALSDKTQCPLPTAQK